MSYELGWRHLADPTLSASRAVLAQTGDYLRSALRYAYLLDHRDNPVVPGDGWALRAASELGGLSPDNASRAVKQQLDVQVTDRGKGYGRCAAPVLF